MSTTAGNVIRLLRTGTNAKSVHADSRKPFRFLLCGDPGLIAELRRTLLAGHDGFVPLDAAATLETIDISAGRTIVTEDAKCILFLGRGSDAAAAPADLRDHARRTRLPGRARIRARAREDRTLHAHGARS